MSIYQRILIVCILPLIITFSAIIFTINNLVNGESTENVAQTIATTSVLGLVLLTLILSFTIRGILKPIKKLTESANMIASGNLDFNLDSILDVELEEDIGHSKNEIHVLFVALKKMLMQLNNMEELLDLTEKLEATSKAKSNFLAKMSHEIRTPMNAVIGMSELALREDMSPVAKDYILTIKQASANLLSIINDILDFSKIESGKLEIVPVDYHFSSLINDVASIIKMRLMESSVKFVVNIDRNIPDALFGDEIRIRQVLLNVLSNAVKYTKRGTISFTVNGKMSGNNTIILIMDVSDTGNGIKQEDIGKLFGDFIRVDLASNRGTEGTGLGLAITKNLIDAMNGEISVKSQYGKGSTFTISLPQTIRSHETLGASDKSKIMKFTAPSARVLVVDDISTNLKVAEGLMRPYKMQIDLVLSGEEAINALKTTHYDLVFMDHMMPEMDGIETTKILRDLGYATPIIALTANAIFGMKEQFIANGFNDFLSKPIDMGKLNTILERWIPKEKQENNAIPETNANTNNTNDTNTNDTGIKIKGINMEEGLAMVGGDMDCYLQLLAIFHKDCVKKIEEIKECLKIPNYNLYTVYAHAIKGAAANIGAVGLSNAARELEMASKRGDTAFINSRNASLLTDLRALLDEINEILQENG